MSESRRLPYNKACGLEDFADPDLVPVLRDVYRPEAERSASYPAGAERRKHWEVAMSVRALRDFGALRPDAEILGVGAGSEVTLFHLTRHVRRVVATDLYLAPGVWEREAHPLMLVAPERLSPVPFERERLEVLHMDGRWLRFPDDSFDGIFSSGSIEHFGDFEDIAAAAYEMGRVLKPGGILTLSTELLLDGPPGAIGWPGVMLFSPEGLRRHLVEASGLETVDALDLAVSRPTLATARPLVEMIDEVESGRETFPHLVLSHDGQLFGSVHLTLRKTERYPAADNAWARPSEELRARVQRSEAEAEKRLFGAPAPVAAPAAPPPAAGEPGEAALLEEAFRSWEAVRSRSSLQAPEQGAVRRVAGFLGRTALRVRDLGVSWALQRNLFRALIDHQTGVERRLAELEAAVAGLKTSEADILGALNEIWKLYATADPGDRANLNDRQEILRVRQTRLEGAVADLREELAALSGQPSAPFLPLTQRDMAEILTNLDKETHAALAGAVEISFQDARAESLLVVAHRHFGTRLSCSGTPYRGPSDLWIHVDFTAHWNRHILLENAATRLVPGGRFVLVTAPVAGDPPAHSELVLAEDRNMPLVSGGAVRVMTWRR
jgi:SAM-dependent methyltransferase